MDSVSFSQQFRSWSDIPTALLQQELSKRDDVVPIKPACGTKAVSSYNTSIHVGGLFLILALSVLACAFPIAAKRIPGIKVPHRFLFLSRHFGTGVLIATAFVHLFPTAYISLTDPCLPSFWNESYPAMPGLIAMSSVFVVVGVEMFFAMRGAGHIHHSEFDNYDEDGDETFHRQRHGNGAATKPKDQRSVSFRGVGGTRSGGSTNGLLAPDAEMEHLMRSSSPLIGEDTQPAQLGGIGSRRSIDSDKSSDVELDELTVAESGLLNGRANGTQSASSSAGLTPTRPDPKALLQCLLLEAGILFHSVFIGMALSVTPVPAFWVLLVAISFHQTFEGLALGSRIAALTWGPNAPQPWLMALAYGTTTPMGQALGLAIHRAYDPASQTGLLSVGIMNALSSGLLLFAGLVELLAADFLSEESYATLTGKKRMHACISVVAGAGLMALVGAWA